MSKSLNYLLPKYQFKEYHSIFVNGEINDVFMHVKEMDLSDSKIACILMYIWRIVARFFINDLSNSNMSVSDFIQLEYLPPFEISRGLIGGGGKPKNYKKISPEEFKDFNAKETIKLVWAFWLSSELPKKTIIHTETRVFCSDRPTYIKFLLYWIIIRPWSGLIRIRLLKSIKKKTELVKIL
ncbi:MAG: hypothetical protein CBC47_07090 [Alphaproteobacteria bacterium TMED87]|nr:hypothetical protein [Rhodospirillaceae bacterium]OUV08616.1 MAG: hypothetical protein CBC47_07090 [Alphaproteobacteria bacterium TMED87]